MLVCRTGLVDWDCPICGVTNKIFLTEGKPLPDELDCSFCDHESGKRSWDNSNLEAK